MSKQPPLPMPSMVGSTPSSLSSDLVLSDLDGCLPTGRSWVQTRKLAAMLYAGELMVVNWRTYTQSNAHEVWVGAPHSDSPMDW